MLSAVASGDLNHRITNSYKGQFGLLKESANQTSQRLAEIVAQIQIATSEVDSAAAEISSGTSDLADRTE